MKGLRYDAAMLTVSVFICKRVYSLARISRAGV